MNVSPSRCSATSATAAAPPNHTQCSGIKVEIVDEGTPLTFLGPDGEQSGVGPTWETDAALDDSGPNLVRAKPNHVGDEPEGEVGFGVFDEAVLLERFNRTFQVEWAHKQVFTSNTERAQALPSWLGYYNHQRTHSALSRRPPISRVSPT